MRLTLQAACDFPETFFSLHIFYLHGVMKGIVVDTESAPRSYIMLWLSPGTVVVNLETAYEGQR